MEAVPKGGLDFRLPGIGTLAFAQPRLAERGVWSLCGLASSCNVQLWDLRGDPFLITRAP